MDKLYAIGYQNNHKCPSKLGAVLVVKKHAIPEHHVRERILGVEPILDRSQGFTSYVHVDDVLFYSSKLSVVSEAIEKSNFLNLKLEEIKSTAQHQITTCLKELEDLFPSNKVAEE
jgi:hypothetical protein